MSAKRLLLAGRITGDPMPIAGGDLVTLSVHDGQGSHLWAVIRSQDQHLDKPFADGDAVAIVGTVDPSRRASGALHGPITIDAVIGLKSDGVFFGSI